VPRVSKAEPPPVWCEYKVDRVEPDLVIEECGREHMVTGATRGGYPDHVARELLLHRIRENTQ
jgi:hypothetical protein